jgi:SAM-dependent methyltransferase
MANVADYVARNRAQWDRWATDYVAPGREAWAAEAPRWGIWGVPESELGLFEGIEEGMDAIELGCGTAYVSAWLAKIGAYPVGVDISDVQLDTARWFQREFGLSFPLLRANAEEVPFEDESFDLVISEYGASIWCDPFRWVPEATRLLRPGGRLIFMVNGTLLMACTPENGEPARRTLSRDYFGMHRFEFPGEDAVEFHLGYGDWIRLLRANGLVVEDLVEVQPPAGATTRFEFVSAEWAHRWPSEEVWKARKPV